MLNFKLNWVFTLYLWVALGVGMELYDSPRYSDGQGVTKIVSTIFWPVVVGRGLGARMYYDGNAN